MRITVRVKPRSRQEKIEKIDEINYIISVKEPPVEGKANKAVVKALAQYFKTAPSNISIIGGETSKIKVIEIG